MYSYVFLLLGVDTGFQLFLLDHPHSRHAALRHSHAPRRRDGLARAAGVGVASPKASTSADASSDTSSANISSSILSSARPRPVSPRTHREHRGSVHSHSSSHSRPHSRSPSFTSRHAPSYRTHGGGRGSRRSSGIGFGVGEVHSTRVDGSASDAFAVIKIAQDDRSGPILCAQVSFRLYFVCTWK